MGLCYIATALKKHDVEMLDPTQTKTLEEITGKINNFKPQIVCISIRNVDTTQRRDIFYYFKTISPTVQLIKGINPEIKVILGGVGFSMFAETIMERIPESDYGIYLEGEVVVTEAPRFASIASEVAASISEAVFDWLDKPVVRVGARHAPIAHSPVLFESVIPQAADIERAARSMLEEATS